MNRYAVIGASSGTGHAITSLLAARGDHVIAISRRGATAETGVTPVAADVQDAAALERALSGELDAVFFTVDIHGFRRPKEDIHNVMAIGCTNAMQAAIKVGAKQFVLLSVMGAENPSLVWSLLNFVKPGMQDNVLLREQALKRSGLPYIIVRAPRLDNTAAGSGNTLALVTNQTLGMKRSVSRNELARLMVGASDTVPAYEGSTWDVVKNA